MKDIKSLTSLRGLFSLYVVVFHSASRSPIVLHGVMWIVSRGYLAVDFFFILSGFILAEKYGPDFVDRFRRQDYLRFLVKRIGRLFPLHWVVFLFSYLILVFIEHETYPIIYIFADLTLTERWFPALDSGRTFGPYWSISTEWAANIMFPFFAWANLRSSVFNSTLMVFGSLFLLVYVAHQNDWVLGASAPKSRLALLRCFAEFSIGMLVCRHQVRLSMLRHDIIIILLCGIAIGLLHFPKSDIFVVVLMALMIPAFVENDGFINRGLSSNWITHLGKISYSIYLTHLILVGAVHSVSVNISNPFLAFLVYWVGVFSLVIIVSNIMFATVERLGNLITSKAIRLVFGRSTRQQRIAIAPAD